MADIAVRARYPLSLARGETTITDPPVRIAQSRSYQPTVDRTLEVCRRDGVAGLVANRNLQ